MIGDWGDAIYCRGGSENDRKKGPMGGWFVSISGGLLLGGEQFFFMVIVIHSHSHSVGFWFGKNARKIRCSRSMLDLCTQRVKRRIVRKRISR